MLSNYEREKLIQAIAFFAENTEHCGLTKIYKLLNFLDFEHYKAIGRSVTALGYKAWPRGPLPPALDEEIKHGVKSDMAAVVRFEEHEHSNGKKFYKVKVLDDSKDRLNLFSPREEEIMKRLAKDFKHHKADQMIEATHLPNQPWDRVYRQEGKPYEEIPYDYSVPDKDKEFIDLVKSENGEINIII